MSLLDASSSPPAAAACGISLVAPHNPRTIAAAYPLSAPLHHCAPLHRSGTCAHNFCQRCKRAEQKLITLKSFIKKVYFLLANGTGQQSLHHSPPPSLSLTLFYARKRSRGKAKQKQTSNHKMSVVVYFRLVICRCYAYFYLFGLPIVSAK